MQSRTMNGQIEENREEKERTGAPESVEHFDGRAASDVVYR